MTVLTNSRTRKCRTRQKFSFFSHRERSELSQVSGNGNIRAMASMSMTRPLSSTRNNNLHPMSSPLGGYDVTELSRHCMSLVANPIDQVRVATYDGVNSGLMGHAHSTCRMRSLFAQPDARACIAFIYSPNNAS